MLEDSVNLFLDDDPNRAALWYNRSSKEDQNRTIWVTTAPEAIGVLKDYIDRLKDVHLDHDLGGMHFVDSSREDTGMEVVRWLEKQNKSYLLKARSIEFTVHTWNIPAGERMTKRLADLGLKVSHKPFGM